MMSNAESPASAIRSLAAVADALPAPVGGIEVAPDGRLALAERPGDLAARFAFENLGYHLRVVGDERGRWVCLAAELGYVPYTVQAPERRRAVLLILRAAQGLPTVRFRLDHGYRIRLEASRLITDPVTLPRLFLEVAVLLHEARPFTRLLGQHL